MPEKEIVLEIEDAKYIPLETTDEVLMGNLHRIKHISEEKIIVSEGVKGDIFVFNHEGKITTQFNHIGEKDGTGYTRIDELVYDETNKELFVFDRSVTRLVQIYSENGEYRRSFRLPEQASFSPILNFDNETLLAYDTYNLDHKSQKSFELVFNYHKADSADNHIVINNHPYTFLSKKDGHIVSNVNICLPDRIPTVYVNQAKRSFYITSRNRIIKCGSDFLLTDVASDTIYSLSRDKTFVPLFIRKPSVYSMEPQTILNIRLITGKYLYMTKSIFNTEDGFGGKPEDLIYDRQDNQMYRVKQFKVVDAKGEFPPDWDVLGRYVNIIDGNIIVRLLPADQLKEDLEAGRLKGKLKEIAFKMDEEDNPVVEIIKIR